MLALPNRFETDQGAVAWGRIGDGPPLVLVHGTPFSAQVWRRIAPVLARRWTVYFYDLIGYGLSDKAEGQDVSLGVQNGILAALVRDWSLTRPDVLCHDFGAATVLRAHYLDGLRFGSLTMFDAVALTPWGSPFVGHVRAHEAAFAGLPAYAHDALLRAYLQGAAHAPLSEDALVAYMAPWQGPVGQAAFYRQIAQMDLRYTQAIEDRFGPMDCPVTLLWGEEDTWLPLHQGRRLAERFTQGRLTIVPQAGHLLQDDAPEAIVGAMLSQPWG